MIFHDGTQKQKMLHDYGRVIRKCFEIRTSCEISVRVGYASTDKSQDNALKHKWLVK